MTIATRARAETDPRDRDEVRHFLQKSDEQSFRALYRRHTPYLYQFALRMGQAPEVAEEVVQEAWVRAVTALPEFRWQSSLRTWLCGIAVNCWREMVRKRVRGKEASLPPPEALPSPAPKPHQKLDLERLVGELPERYREVLVLHDIEGYSHEEIGRLLQIEVGTSKSQLSRARKSLRARLNETRFQADRGKDER